MPKDTPLQTLAKINALMKDIDDAQATIDEARAAFPLNKAFNMQLDDAQLHLDVERFMLEVVKNTISGNN